MQVLVATERTNYTTKVVGGCESVDLDGLSYWKASREVGDVGSCGRDGWGVCRDYDGGK